MFQKHESNPQDHRTNENLSSITNHDDMDSSSSAAAAAAVTDVLVPPLNPYSPQEIAHFIPIDLALRSNKEFVQSAGNAIATLNPNSISRLVQGIQYFQNLHLGKDSITFSPPHSNSNFNSWPMVKIPDEFFRCRSPTGPLFTILLSAYHYKARQSNWRQFDFQSKNRFQDNLLLLKQIQQDLMDSGKWIRPRVYFDKSVPSSMQEQLRSILIQFGGTQVFHLFDDEDAKGTLIPTHIVCLDTEEHDSTAMMEQEAEEQQQGTTGTGGGVQKQFLRTIKVIDPLMKKSTGIIETTMQESKKKGGKVKNVAGIVFEHPMAFVHWWYWPSSADQWMPAADVAGPDSDLPPRPEGGPWVVGCKFIRDVQVFNEWGVEADYAVVDYEKKLHCWKELEQGLLARQSAKEVMEGGPSSSNLNKSSTTAVKLRLSIPSKKENTDVQRLEKRKAVSGLVGMQPRQVFTGYYADNGTKIRRTVFDGALNIPPFTTDLVRQAIKSAGGIVQDWKDRSYPLPTVGNIRPLSENPDIDLIITELRAGNSGSTMVTARHWNSSGNRAQRIRGGGSGSGDDDVEMKDINSVVKGSDTLNSDTQEVPSEMTTLQEEIPSDDVAATALTTPPENPIDMNITTEISTAVPDASPDNVSSTVDTSANYNIPPEEASENPSSLHPKAIPLPQSQDDSPSEKPALTGDQEPTINLPEWYDSKSVSTYEQTLLPEWFNGSAVHRTESSYILTRERIIDEARKSSGKYLTITSVRRCVPGDVGSLMRLFDVLVSHGFINGSAVNESAPTTIALTKQDSAPSSSTKWSKEQLILLAEAVERNMIKSMVKCEETGDKMCKTSVDWDSVAKEIGHGITPLDCCDQFLSTDFSELKNESSTAITDISETASHGSLETFFSDAAREIKPELSKKIVDMAIEFTEGSLESAHKMSVLGVLGSIAYESARKEEETISRLLQEVLDQRMAKLENRLSLLDDLEGILEAERIAMELERRDLYTNRCRYWFNGEF